MAQVINTNVASLNAQRNLNKSQGNLQTSLQRLSSGLRINSARDDAAGLAISERFTTQIRGLNQAARNASDGISLAQTGEGDLAQITNNLQRIRELAVQSANATNSASDRAALQLETSELIAEIERVSSTSAFNGVKLLDGSFSSQLFQVGANAGETVSIASIASARTSAIGQVLTAAPPAGTVVAGDLTAGELIINGNDVGVVAQDALAIANAITATSSNVSATATNAQTGIAFADAVGAAAVPTATAATVALGAFTPGADTADIVNDLEITFDNGAGATLVVTTVGAATTVAADVQTAFTTAGFAADGTGTVNGFNLNLNGAGTIAAAVTAGGLDVERADGINFTTTEVATSFTTDPGFANTATTADGIPASAATAPAFTLSIDGNALDFTTVGSDGTITAADVAGLINGLAGYTATAATATTLDITKDDGSNIVFIEGGLDSDATEGLVSDGSAAAATTTLFGNVTVVGINEDLVIGGTNVADSGLSVGTTTAVLAGTTIANTDVSTVAGANSAIASVDSALTTINNSRASLGAIQNRFDSIVQSIETSSENLSSARSRIRDADFAAETASLTRNQILQQAGVSILSQANSLPQLVLSLLQ